MKVALLRFNPDRIMWGTINDGMRMVYDGKVYPHISQVPHFETPLNVILITSEYIGCGAAHHIYRKAVQIVGDDLVLDKLVVCEVLDGPAIGHEND